MSRTHPLGLRGRRALTAFLAVALLAAVASVGAAPAPVSAQSSDAGNYLSRINSLRASRGAAPLQIDGNLSGLAQSWAQNLANQGALAHAGDLSVGVSSPWTKLGENVGMGPDTATIFNAFVNSSAHYANLVDPAFTHIGIGVVWVGPVQYTAHRFMAVGGPAPPPAPAPPPTTAAPRTSGGSGSFVPAPPAEQTSDATADNASNADIESPAPVEPPPATAERVGAIVAAFRAIPS